MCLFYYFYLDGHRDAHGLGVVPLPGPALGAVVGVAPLDHLLLEQRGVLDHGLSLDVNAAGLHLGGVVGGLALGGLDGGAEGLLGDLPCYWKIERLETWNESWRLVVVLEQAQTLLLLLEEWALLLLVQEQTRPQQ